MPKPYDRKRHNIYNETTRTNAITKLVVQGVPLKIAKEYLKSIHVI